MILLFFLSRIILQCVVCD